MEGAACADWGAATDGVVGTGDAAARKRLPRLALPTSNTGVLRLLEMTPGARVPVYRRGETSLRMTETRSWCNLRTRSLERTLWMVEVSWFSPGAAGGAGGTVGD